MDPIFSFAVPKSIRKQMYILNTSYTPKPYQGSGCIYMFKGN